MIEIRSEEELNKIRSAGSIVRNALNVLYKNIRPGASTYDLDKLAEDFIIKNDGEPAFKGYRGYPSTICCSINAQVVHGIPDKNILLKDGDIVGIDVGAGFDGYYADAAQTFSVGKISEKAQSLLNVTKKCLEYAISRATEKYRLSDISHVIQQIAESNGYNVVRAFVGHGIGRNIHEEPEIPNFGEPGKGPRLKEGMVLAIEPMVNSGTSEVLISEDGWTATTKDKTLSCHFEHTVLVKKDKAEIIT